MHAPEQIAQNMAMRMRESFGFDLRGTAGQQWLTECVREIIAEATEPLHKLHEERDAIGRSLDARIEAGIARWDGLRSSIEREAVRVNTDDAPDSMSLEEATRWIVGYLDALKWMLRILDEQEGAS